MGRELQGASPSRRVPPHVARISKLRTSGALTSNRFRFRDSLTDRPSFPQSCETEQYVHNAKSQVVNTAWGELRRILKLHHAGTGPVPVLLRGAPAPPF